MARILPIARSPSIWFLSIVRTFCSGHDELGCSVSTVTMTWNSRELGFDYVLDNIFTTTLLRSGMHRSVTYWSIVLSLCLFCWNTPFGYLLQQRCISKPLRSGVHFSITYWSRDLSLRLLCLAYTVQLPTAAGVYLYASSAGVHLSVTYWSRDVSLSLFGLEYTFRLPTGAAIYLYASSVWSTPKLESNRS
jgi:hypothetical protein